MNSFVLAEERLVNGKIRKYYAATPDGDAMLREARVKLAELVTEVVHGDGPRHLGVDESSVLDEDETASVEE